MTTRERVDISIIGDVQARIAETSVHIPRGRPRILLAALALEAGRPVTVSRLMDYLWGDALPENPRASLQNLIRRLRQLVGAETIRTFPEGYQLDLPAEWVDVHRFRQLADELAACPAEELARRRTLITSMSELWRDEPLADVGSTSLVREYAPALFERYLAMVEARAEVDIATGHQTRAIGDLRELTARLPLHESLWARLLRVLRDTGRVAEALDTYEQLRTMLIDELGADPSPALRELHRQLLTTGVAGPTEESASPPAPAPAGSTSVGTALAETPGIDRSSDHPTGQQTGQPTEQPAEHRAEQSSAGPAERGTEPSAASTGPDAERRPEQRSERPTDRRTEPPRQLPPEPVGFVGRTAEADLLDRALERCRRASEGRAHARICLVVLHGPGGVGKTALATHWAHRVSPDFPDGQLYVDLQGFGPATPLDPHRVLGMLLRSLGVPNEDVPADTAERSALFRTRVADRRTLLVLDNAHDEDQVRPLLPGSGAMVLITSRSRLRDLGIREGAVGIELPEFPDEDARSLIGHALGAGRIAEGSQPIDELVRLCGGLPLALRIAAELCSRYPDTALHHLVEDLGKPTETPGPLIDGLSAVFSWTYQALPPPAAQLFRRLGRFPGRTIGVEGAAVLADQDRRATAALLDTLVDVHLVEEPRPGRYWLHDLTRGYAAERFRAEEDEAEQTATVQRMLDWYLHATATAGNALGYSKPFVLSDRLGVPTRPLPRFDDHTTAMRWLETELPSILEIVEDAAEHEHDEHGWQFGRALQYFLIATSRPDDRLRVTELGLAAAERIGRSEAIQQAASWHGGALKDVGQRERAEDVLRLSLRHARDREDYSHMAAVLSVLGVVVDESGDCRRAATYHDQAIETARRSGDGDQLAAALVNSGSNAIGYGDLDKAISESAQALRWYVEQGKKPLQAVILGNLAAAHAEKDEFETAEDYARQALAILESLGDRRYAATVLTDLGHIHARRGRPAQAAEAWQRASTLLGPTDWRHPDLRAALASLPPEHRPDVG